MASENGTAAASTFRPRAVFSLRFRGVQKLSKYDLVVSHPDPPRPSSWRLLLERREAIELRQTEEEEEGTVRSLLPFASYLRLCLRLCSLILSVTTCLQLVA